MDKEPGCRRRRPGRFAAAAAAAEQKAAVSRAQRIDEGHAGELQSLREPGTLEQAEPRDEDEAVRDELNWRAGGYVQADS